MTTHVDPTTASEAVLVQGLPPEELAFNLTSGRVCLDLVATIGERWRRGFERLRTPEDLARWCVAAGLVPSPPRVTAAALEDARRLRGGVARVLLAWGAGAPLPPGDVAILNAAAARSDLAPQLTVAGTPGEPQPANASAALSTVARDAIDLVLHGAPERLRECAAEDCALLFYDASRPGARRWCSMDRCGNRHKTAAYRRRRRA